VEGGADRAVLPNVRTLRVLVLVPYCRGSFMEGVVSWVLAILTIDCAGEDHQQEKRKEIETNN